MYLGFLLLIFLSVQAECQLSLSRLWINNPGLEAECDGQCGYSMSCWMSGGVVTHGCGAVFQYCCERPGAASPRFWRNPHFGNGISVKEELPDISYGPVVNDPLCGKPTISTRRIVGGSEAGFGNFPWQALIRIGSSRCGGALISPYFVVTAGHCVNSAEASSIRVYLGEYTLYQRVEPLPRMKYSVSSIELHPHYRFTPQADRFDVALLRLKSRVLYQPHISPICLPSKNQIYKEGTLATVAGWGALQPDSPVRPNKLQAVDVRTISNRRCELWHKHKGIYVDMFKDMLCAGYRNGKRDACQGDSGGPLAVKDSVKGRWVLIGLVSAGYSCAKAGQPGIYHQVSKSSDWISYHIRRGL
eukprot:TRINITY_DN4102_c2_g2_i1.p1 TRINITY_DN4102_c2_g2~~TRINITY_DN4102_c2_g2_i1.p1  ORF type:complete len:359 (+),score=81.83 TRINITY_DN4102_c2_g2_i1:147-1223(+)